MELHLGCVRHTAVPGVSFHGFGLHNILYRYREHNILVSEFVLPGVYVSVHG
jgi:hypothetical protein